MLHRVDVVLRTPHDQRRHGDGRQRAAHIDLEPPSRHRPQVQYRSTCSHGLRRPCGPVPSRQGQASQETGAEACIVSELPETRFTRVDDLDIAYQVVGPAAELDLVFVPGWVSHLEVMWELPEFAHFLERLAAMGRLILFDKRGTGLSDRVPGVPTLEQRADDIVAVMDAAGSAGPRSSAWGEGAGIAAMFAATHPERVAALVLGSLPVKTDRRCWPVVADPAVMQALSDGGRSTAGGRPAWYRYSRRPEPRTPGSCPGTGGGSGCRRPLARRPRRCAGRWRPTSGRSRRRSRPGR